mgnify:CR=1 FL=1
MRRRPGNRQPPSTLSLRALLESLEDQMQAEPARTWVEVMEKWRFLLDRYAKTPEAGDDRIPVSGSDQLTVEESLARG